MRPHLFKAVLMDVPFLDVLTALLDENLPLTSSDFDEFGNPIKDETFFDLITSYSPYENLNNQEYPFVFINAGIDDHRAPIWGILKYINRFRERAKKPEKVEEISEKNVLVNFIEGGHHGESEVVESIKNKCFYFGLLDYVLLEANKEIDIKMKIFN